MSANIAIDKVSALLYAKSFGDRFSSKLVNDLAKLIDERDDDVSMDDIHDCVRALLQDAMNASDEEFVSPNYDILSASEEDIRAGRMYDVQDVIDGLQGENH